MTHDPQPARIALVITELDWGGAERCLTHLAARLDRDFFEPVVIALAPPPAPPRDALVAQLEQADVPAHFLGLSSKRQLFSAVRRLRKCLNHYRPMLVQSMLFHANVVTGLALRALPDVSWCTGIRVADPSRSRQAIESRLIARCCRVVCVSQMVASFATRRMGIDPEKLEVIPNGIDVVAGTPRPPIELSSLGVPAPQRAITCVARLATQKGIDQLMLAAPRILQALPSYDLLIVGDGPQASHLRQMAESSGFASRIHFCGWQPNAGAILAASDLMVLPSRWEGMPNVLLEAMASSVPVVCTRVEGVLEVLGPLAERQTVAVDSPQELADKVVMTLSSPTAARDLGRANQARITEAFSLSTMVKRYEQLYGACLRGKRLV